jgi:hypothetical protein
VSTENSKLISLIARLDELQEHMLFRSSRWIDIVTDGGCISIENRPLYCDRGKFILKVFPNNIEVLYIDDSDMFPRYYFKFENLISELDCWVMERKLTILNIDKKDIE